MAIERQSPDSILTQTNLVGSVGDIQDDPDSPDGNWLLANSNNADSDLVVDFPTPTGSPNTGAGLQEFKFWARLTGNGTACSYDIYLVENGTRLNAGSPIASGSLTSTTGQLITATWDASLLGTADGSLVEAELNVRKSGGSPANRTTGEVGAVEWNVDYTATATRNGGLIGTLAAVEGSFTGTQTEPTHNGTLVGVLAAVEGSFTGTRVQPTHNGTLAGTLAAMEGSFTGTQTAPARNGTLVGVLAAMEGSMVGAADSRAVFLNTSQSTSGWVRQPYTAWADTSATYTVTQGGLPIDTDLDLAVVDRDARIGWSPTKVQITNASTRNGTLGGTLSPIEGSIVGVSDSRSIYLNTTQTQVGWVRQGFSSWSDTQVLFTVNKQSLPIDTNLEVALVERDGTVNWSNLQCQITSAGAPTVVFAAFGA